jgi:hypothetical protein
VGRDPAQLADLRADLVEGLAPGDLAELVADALQGVLQAIWGVVEGHLLEALHAGEPLTGKMGSIRADLGDAASVDAQLETAE